MKRWLGACVICVTAVSADCFGESFLDSVSIADGIKGLRMPIVGPTNDQVALLTCEEVRLKNRQVGPFSIGLLPVVIFKNTRIQVSDGADPLGWVTGIQKFLTSARILSSSILNNLNVVRTDGSPLLCAQTARFLPNRDALVMNNVRIQTASAGQLFFSEAELPLSCDDEGVFWLQTRSVRIKIDFL